MNYGVYISASGMLTAMRRLDTAANNLANSETVGFKADIANVLARDAQRIEDGTMGLPSNELLEMLGAGTTLGPTRVQFAQGAIEPTKNDLDAAISGDGFFMVEGLDGKPRLTRDGRFTMNSEGQLVQASTGSRVLNESGTAISLNRSSPVTIDATGHLRQRGQIVGSLGFVDVADRSALKKEGRNQFSLYEGTATTAASGRVMQRAVERSGADPVRSMLDISAAQRDVEMASKMIMTHDEILARAIGTFGRLA